MAKFVASLLFAAVPVTLVCLGVLLSMRMALGCGNSKPLRLALRPPVLQQPLCGLRAGGHRHPIRVGQPLLTVVIWGLFLAAGAVESTVGFAYDQIQEDIERVQNGDERPKNKRRRRSLGRGSRDGKGRFRLRRRRRVRPVLHRRPAFDRAARLESLEEFAANAALTERIAAIRWPLPKGWRSST